MKKRIVNGLLSTAVVTSIIFAATACGSQDDAQDAVIVESAVTGNIEAESETVANTETETAITETAETTGNVSLEAWVNSDMAVAILDSMNESYASQGMSAAFEADGDVFSMIITLDDTIDVADGAQEAMSQLLDYQASIFDSVRDELIQQTGNTNIMIHIVYINGDGTEILSKDF